MTRESEAVSRYFVSSTGRTYIPIGLNLCFPRFDATPEAGMARYARWIDRLADHGGNFMRLWLGHPFFDPEPVQAGVFDEMAARRLDAVLERAGSRGVLVKITLEHFRSLEPRGVAEVFPGAASFARPVYAKKNGGYADDMGDFLENPECRRRYLEKLDRLAARYANHPAIFGWELWNEMNAVRHPGWLDWTRFMLPELRRRFPGHRVMQSLGSYDRAEKYETYRAYANLGHADLVQVHRYIDPGAESSFCHGPMDTLCADAVATMRDLAPGKPVLLAETGAVEAGHAAPSRLYERDNEGVLLHDLLFAAFFAGAAGPGHVWHWDFYVEKHDLWWHYGRFARALGDFDPVAEGVRPEAWETDTLRVYALIGRRVSLVWLRDRDCDWRTELVDGRSAVARHHPPFALSGSLADTVDAVCYDPWRDSVAPVIVTNGEVALPAFARSSVLRIARRPVLARGN